MEFRYMDNFFAQCLLSHFFYPFFSEICMFIFLENSLLHSSLYVGNIQRA